MCPSGDISPRLCSSVELVPPPGTETGMWLMPGQVAIPFCWLHWLVQWRTCNPSQTMRFNPVTFAGTVRKEELLKICSAINRRMTDAWSGREFPYREHLLHNNVTTNERKKENWVLRIWQGSSPWTQPALKLWLFPSWEPTCSFLCYSLFELELCHLQQQQSWFVSVYSNYNPQRIDYQSLKTEEESKRNWLTQNKRRRMCLSRYTPEVSRES